MTTTINHKDERANEVRQILTLLVAEVAEAQLLAGATPWEEEKEDYLDDALHSVADRVSSLAWQIRNANEDESILRESEMGE